MASNNASSVGNTVLSNAEAEKSEAGVEANLGAALDKAQTHAEHAKAFEAKRAADILTDGQGAQSLLDMLAGDPAAFAVLVQKMSQQQQQRVQQEEVVKHQWALNIAQQAVDQFMIDKVDANGSLGIRAQVKGNVVEPDGREENWTISLTFKRTSSIRTASKPVLRSDKAVSHVTVAANGATETIQSILNRQ